MKPRPLGVVRYEGFADSSFNRDPEEAAVDRSDFVKNQYRQLPTASELGSVLVRHSLAAGGCWPRVTRENGGSGSSLLWVAVKRISHHAFQAYLKATRSAGGFFTEGHFAFWDALCDEFPHLAILNCASGGRRLDLESILRGQPLWRSDYNCFPEATSESTQDHSYGIQHWLPIQGSMIRGWSLFDTYEARSALSPGMENALVAKTPEEWLRIKANVAQARRCKKYFFGDYYPLTNQQRNSAAWTAYQLYLPTEQEGMILALRRGKSDVRAMTFDLLTIDPAKQWKFEDYDSGDTWVVSGEQIREEGFKIDIPNRRDSRLIFFSIKRAER